MDGDERRVTSTQQQQQFGHLYEKYPRPATNWQNAAAKQIFPLDSSEGSLDGSAPNCVTKMDSVVNQ